MTRILGIDPGSHRTGWGVVEKHGSRLGYLASGVVGGGDGALPDRLRAIADGLDHVIGRFLPDAVAIEALFVHRGHRGVLALGHARGVALVCVARAGVPLFEYAPAAVKQATGGSGRATKGDVQRMVGVLLGRPVEMAVDASDALAVAICHVHASPGRMLLEAAIAQRRR